MKQESQTNKSRVKKNSMTEEISSDLRQFNFNLTLHSK